MSYTLGLIHSGREIRKKTGCSGLRSGKQELGSHIQISLQEPNICLPSPVGSGEYWFPVGICPLQPEVRGWQLVPRG